MTVTYTDQVTTSNGFGIFWKLLFRWRGSIYKLILHEFLLYCFCYTVCSMVYRLALSESQKRMFEGVAQHIETFITLIPVAFVLGFYVSIIMTRWWDMYMTIPRPDTLAVFVSANIHGQNEQARVLRRTIMRYVNLSYAITFARICPPMKMRFPTMEHMVNVGILTEQEHMIFQILDAKYSNSKYWMPLIWAGAVVSKARIEGRIKDDFAVKTIMDEIDHFRRGCSRLVDYDFISVPLVYTQVVTLAVYTFFISTIMGRQFLDPKQGIVGHKVDFYFPVFTLLQFIFYMGWLKVAESLINPFGEDEDDFEINDLFDRNVAVSYLIVDEMHQEHPELIKDMYYDEVVPTGLNFTVAAAKYQAELDHGSTSEMKISEKGQEILVATRDGPPPVVETMSNLKRSPSVDLGQSARDLKLPAPMESKEAEAARSALLSSSGSSFSLDSWTKLYLVKRTLGRLGSAASRARVFKPVSSSGDLSYAELTEVEVLSRIPSAGSLAISQDDAYDIGYPSISEAPGIDALMTELDDVEGLPKVSSADSLRMSHGDDGLPANDEGNDALQAEVINLEMDPKTSSAGSLRPYRVDDYNPVVHRRHLRLADDENGSKHSAKSFIGQPSDDCLPLVD